jgi:hypothetical protein
MSACASVCLYQQGQATGASWFAPSKPVLEAKQLAQFLGRGCVVFVCHVTVERCCCEISCSECSIEEAAKALVWVEPVCEACSGLVKLRVRDGGTPNTITGAQKSIKAPSCNALCVLDGHFT